MKNKASSFLRGSLLNSLLFTALMVMSYTACASLVYSFSIASEGETIVGSITTDGTTGDYLSSQNISAWNLQASGPVNVTIASSNFGSAIECPPEGCGLLPAGTYLYFIPTLFPTGTQYISFLNGGDAISLNGYTDFVNEIPYFQVQSATGQSVKINLQPSTLLGTVTTVPEPTDFVLMLSGLCLIAIVTIHSSRPSKSTFLPSTEFQR